MVTKQAKKQKRAQINAPLHKKQKAMSAMLSDELIEDYDRTSLPVRKGDVVEITRGQFKDHKGKVERVDLKRGLIFVEGANIPKADGTDRFYPIWPSKVKITKVDMKDEKRNKIVEREQI